MLDIVTRRVAGRAARQVLLAGGAAMALMGCKGPVDLDLRGNLGGFSTTEAALTATADRPKPDDRGIISYPNYQVVVSRRGDTVAEVADRIGADPGALADYNGLQPDDRLRRGEVLALPDRVAEPSPETGAVGTGPIVPADQVDIAALAGGAIDRAGDQKVEVSELPPAQRPQTGAEPVRHKVKRGETAYTISRLYNVSVRSLADWNGLDKDFKIREGQFLMIPVAEESAPRPVERPGEGSPTPVPPSAGNALPEEKTEPLVAAPKPVERPREKPKERQVTQTTLAAAGTAAAAAGSAPKPAAKPAAAPKPDPKPQPKPAAAPDLGKTQTVTKTAAMDYPVKGRIIREYARGRSDGIDIAAAPGTAVRAADGGTVAAITSDADNVRVIVVRHAGKLLTIYSNVDNIAVKEGAKVARGQKIAEIRSGASPYVHFEVRKGLEATDPMAYLK
jgi:murein DD-endopeptidase MepM/ murein hydrolase activator NlpD